MLTIYGVTRSRASRVIWLCHELGLEFRQVPVIQSYRLPDPLAADAQINTLSPEFLQICPPGMVPAIDDDGLVMFESLACTLYLARKHGGALGPQNEAEDALMLQWSLYGATMIEGDALTIMLHHRPDEQAQPGAEQTLVVAAAERLLRPFRVLEAHFAQSRHLVGDRFTVADLNMAEIIRYAQGYGALFEEFPALRDWLADCQARPAFQRMWAARLAEPA